MLTRIKNVLLGEHRLRYSWLCSPRRLAVKRSGKSLPKSLKMRLHCIRWPGAIQFSGQPLAKKSTVTFRVFTWEVTSLNRQVLSFSSSHCHAGDRWKKIPGTPQRSKADSQSLWTRSWKAHQNPKSCPGQGSEGVPEQAEMLSLGCPLLCSEPARLCLRGGAAGMGAPTALLFSCFSKPQGIDPVRCPSPRAEEEAASVLFPSTLVPLQKQKARFRRESTDLKWITTSHNKV